MSNKHTPRQAGDRKQPLNLALILAIDTSSPVAGYAIARGDGILAALTVNDEKPHSLTFFSSIQTVCEMAGVGIEAIELIAAVTGPGSFTGLRVGLAAAKGLSDSLGKPCLGVNALDLLALQSGRNGLCLITLGSSRQEVFCGLRRVAANGQVQSVGEDRVCVPSLIMDLIGKDVGQDAILSHVTTEEFELPLTQTVRVDRAAVNLALPLAVAASRQACERELPPLAAYYIRPSDAEIKKKANE